MIPKISPSLIARAYADPLARLNLAVDFLPILAIFLFGWGATPLVALYWLENLVIGVFAAARILGSGLAMMKRGNNEGAGAFFLAPFFCVHYGGFCWGHGVFLATFAMPEMGFPDPRLLIGWALSSGPHIVWFLAAIIAANLAVFLIDFIGRGEINRVNPADEMGAPYGRIFTLHIAIILGAAFAFGAGDPLMGVLLLILIRVAFGMILAVRQRLKRDAQLADGETGKAVPAAQNA